MTATADSSAARRRGRGPASRAPPRAIAVSATDAALRRLGRLGIRRPPHRLVPELRAADDLEVGVLERRSVGPDERQPRLDCPQHRVCLAGPDVDPERTVARRLAAERDELRAEARTVIGIDEQ